jgi:hypothetical protein
VEANIDAEVVVVDLVGLGNGQGIAVALPAVVAIVNQEQVGEQREMDSILELVVVVVVVRRANIHHMAVELSAVADMLATSKLAVVELAAEALVHS